MPAPIAAMVAKLISLKPGRMTTKAPKKPIKTAIHLLNPTFSFKNTADNNVTIIGEKNIKVRESANGKTEIA